MTGNKIDQILEQATYDASYRERLLADPRTTLASQGVEIPDGVELVVVESAADRLVLPLFPYVGDTLAGEGLANVAGGRIQIRNEILPNRDKPGIQFLTFRYRDQMNT